MKAQRTLITNTLGIALAWFALVAVRAADSDPPNTGMADPVALEAAFDRFAAGAPSANVVLLSLSNLRGLSSEAVNAGGRVSVDLAAGVVESSVRLLPADGSFELWLIDNRPGDGHTTLADPADLLMRIGTYDDGQAGVRRLRETLGAEAFRSFFPDRAFVVRSGRDPKDAFVLTGSSTFFDRLRHRQIRFVDDPTAALGFDPTAQATRAADFAKLVAQGRRLFLKEEFDGNGRTCGTCHVESNNFTVDAEFISTLPVTDPLFVAETNSALATLENPELLRQFGLILVNADGFAPERRFVLRAAQNVQALANSTAAPDPNATVLLDFIPNGLNPNPPERLGWGNDGAPLRDFAIVAIAQHAPRRLDRIAGLDFRVPTDEELDALVAYQLPLGRQEDFNLSSLELKSTLASNGKRLFLDSGNFREPGHKNCNACHFNAGGTAAMSFNSHTPGFPDLDGSPLGFNLSAETNVNETPLALTLGLPRDGGFGQIPTMFASFGNKDGFPPPISFDREEFNSPPLVESADTGPFFHNHTVSDLESAVAFYGTPAFRTARQTIVTPVNISADPDDPEVQAIAAFLRVLNGLENIRSAINVAQRGRRMTTADDMRELAGLSLAETIDARQVLSEGSLARQTEPGILSAQSRLLAARLTLEASQHLSDTKAIDHLMDAAIRHLRAARLDLADPASLPPSFRN